MWKYVKFKSIGYVSVIKSWLFLWKIADYKKIRKHTSKLLEHIRHTHIMKHLEQHHILTAQVHFLFLTCSMMSLPFLSPRCLFFSTCMWCLTYFCPCLSLCLWVWVWLCAVASLFFACLERAHVFAQYVIVGSMHELYI